MFAYFYKQKYFFNNKNCKYIFFDAINFAIITKIATKKRNKINVLDKSSYNLIYISQNR